MGEKIYKTVENSGVMNVVAEPLRLLWECLLW